MKKKLQSLWDMKTIVLILKNNMASFLTGEALFAQHEFEQLVMQFCDENKDRISPQDGETAKNDVDFFLKQIDLAIEHTQKEGSSG
jgi:hypothetical protein